MDHRNALIRTMNLMRVYRTNEVETYALNGIDLVIQKGEFVSIMGPSGSGKTTLLNILGLLDQPTEGTYYFMGHNVTRLSESERATLRKGNIGFVFQNFNLIDELTVFENVELPLLYMRVPAQERQRRVMEILDQFQMAHRRNHYPRQLSSGQQQRTAVARAVVTHPHLILADEPTGNLDTTNGDEIMRLFRELNDQGTTIVMVTHDTSYATYAQRVLHLLDGKLVTESLLRARPYEDEHVSELS